MTSTTVHSVQPATASVGMIDEGTARLQHRNINLQQQLASEMTDMRATPLQHLTVNQQQLVSETTDERVARLPNSH